MNGRDRRRLIAAVMGGRGLLPFSQTFDASADLTAWTIPGTASVAGGTLVITPTYGLDRIVNGNFEAGDPPTSWNAAGGATLSAAADERTGGAGSKSMNAIRGSTAASATQVKGGLTAGQFAYGEVWIKNVDATRGEVYTPAQAGNATTSWAKYILCDANTGATITQELAVVGSAGQQAKFDDYVVQPVTQNTMFCVRDFSKSDVDISAPVTMGTEYTCAGIVYNLDNATNPLNYCITYILRTSMALSARTKKYVNGTVTSIVSTVITYVAGATLRVVKSGTTVKVYYNGTQAGADITVSDAGITSNTIHGVFSGYVSNQIHSISVSTAPG